MTLTVGINSLAERLAHEFKTLRGGVSTSMIPFRTRWVLDDDDWTTDAVDDPYSLRNRAKEDAGDGMNPDVPWDYVGLLVPAGAKIKGLNLSGRTNREVTDVEIAAVLSFPAPSESWETGVASDADRTNAVLFRDMYMAPSLFGMHQITAPSTSLTRQKFEVPQGMQQVPMDAHLSLNMRCVGRRSANFYVSGTWEIEK